MPLLRFRLRTGFALVAVLALALATWNACCSHRSGPPVHFILPDGFRGVIRLIRDDQHGHPIPLTRGVYTYVIPDSGELPVTDFRPFEIWHSEFGFFGNGKAIPKESEAPDGTLALRGGGRGTTWTSETKKSRETIHYVVGTKNDYLKWMRDEKPWAGRFEEEEVGTKQDGTTSAGSNQNSP